MRNSEAQAVMDSYALAIGRLCNAWAWLEASSEQAFANIAGLSPPNATTILMIRCIGFRDRLTAIKIGAISKGKNGLWVEEIIATADYIDNFLRSHRNRFVHDQWVMVQGMAVMHMNATPKVIKNKPDREVYVNPMTATGRTLQEVQDVISEIEDHARFLPSVTSQGHLEAYDLPPDWLIKWTQRRLLRPHAGTQNP